MEEQGHTHAPLTLERGLRRRRLGRRYGHRRNGTRPQATGGRLGTPIQPQVLEVQHAPAI